MALRRLETDQYIKLDSSGVVKIYKTTRDRELEKAAPTFEAIKTRYLAIIAALQQNEERLYYDPEFSHTYQEWRSEFNRYIQSHQKNKLIGNFPLMKKYIPNIEDSIPTLISSLKLRTKGATLEEMYVNAKKFNIFGEVEDC